MSEKTLHTARIVSSIAATAIALACGSNYVYSAWGPQFAEKLRLSSTEQNLIVEFPIPSSVRSLTNLQGLSGNLGMYSMGIPVGMLVDGKGPRPAVIIGAILLGAGYFPLHQAYDRGTGWLPLLCLFSFLTGLGGCAAFAASIKTSALNWPHSRGTATAFPLAAFGLSAFFFSVFAQFAMPGNTGHFLLLLACGTSGLVVVSFFFLRVLPHPHYAALPSNRLHRTKSAESRRRSHVPEPEPGMSTFMLSRLKGAEILNQQDVGSEALDGDATSGADETSSLMSKSSSSPGDVSSEENVKNRSQRVDIRGLRMLPHVEFWQLFTLMGLLTGIGLMTINNIGNDAGALWKHYDDSVTDAFIMKRQALHVSILSLCSFTGRLLSGVGSDVLVNILHASRLWCLTFASLVFLIAQLLALSIQNPNYLFLVSGFTGLAYGFLFGCFPSLVAEAFGVHGLSQNWGYTTIAALIFGNLFNLMFGLNFDKNSVVKESGERVCTKGLECYRAAYFATVVACLVSLVVSLWSIWYIQKKRQKEERLRQEEEREA